MELQEVYGTISRLNAEILAISVDDLPGARQAVQDLGLEFPVLSDPAAEVVNAYGVFNLHNNNLPTPATFIIDREGVIRWGYIGETAASDRPDTSLVIGQLRQLN